MAFKETAISTVDRVAINIYGLTDLKSRLPIKPNDETVKVISEMFDAERWSGYFAPYGLAA